MYVEYEFIRVYNFNICVGVYIDINVVCMYVFTFTDEIRFSFRISCHNVDYPSVFLLNQVILATYNSLEEFSKQHPKCTVVLKLAKTLVIIG